MLSNKFPILYKTKNLDYVLIAFIVAGIFAFFSIADFVNPGTNKKKIYQVSNGAICKLWASESCGLTLSGCDDGATYRCATNTIEIEAGK